MSDAAGVSESPKRPWLRHAAIVPGAVLLVAAIWFGVIDAKGGWVLVKAGCGVACALAGSALLQYWLRRR